jgi:hypothetical protein
LASLIFVVIMVIFAELFKEATEVTTPLGSLFTLLGTVVGAYCGIKSTQDTADKATKQVEKAHKRENAALGALDSSTWEKLRKKAHGRRNDDAAISTCYSITYPSSGYYTCQGATHDHAPARLFGVPGILAGSGRGLEQVQLGSVCRRSCGEPLDLLG